MRFHLIVFLVFIGANLSCSWNIPDQVLISMLHGPNTDMRLSAIQNLSERDPNPRIIEALIQALQDPDITVQGAAVIVLGQFGPKAIAALKPLATLVNSDDETVSTIAISSIAKIGKNDPDALDVMMSLLKSERENVRKIAAIQIAKLGQEALNALPLLKEIAQNDESEAVRLAAEKSIAKLQGAG